LLLVLIIKFIAQLNLNYQPITMKHLYKLSLVLFLLPLFSLAQSNYKPGYVVTLKGDTLHGFIDYQSWDSNPTSISFKSAVTDRKPQKFTVSNISYFNADGQETYQKYTGPISMDVTDYMHLGTGRDTSFRIDSVFLKVLQKGKNVALYSYTDNLKTRFYIGDAPYYTPIELGYKLYLDTQTGRSVTENTYQKQLFALATKYNVLDDNLTNAFASADYRKPDLLPIVSKINKVSKTEYAKKYSDHAKVNFFISAALNAANTTSSSSSGYSEGGGKSYTSLLPALSLGINIAPNPNTGRVQFRADLSFTENQFNTSYQLKVSPYAGVTSSFNQLGVSFIPQVIYNFYNSENFKFYGGVGIALTYLSYSNSSFKSQNPGTSLDGIDTGDPYYFNNINNSFLLKLGVQFNKRFEIFADYFTSSPTTKNGYFEFNTATEQLGFIYFFGK